MTPARLCLALLLAGCAHKSAPPAAAAAAAEPLKPLYQRLGARPAITAVVDQFVANVAADKRINMRFLNTDSPHLKVLLVEFVCTATGGPEKYEGRDMHSSHGGMQLVDEEFNALVEDLAAALDKFNVPAKEKGELLGALGPLKPQIVNPPSAEMQKHDAKLADKARQTAAYLRKTKPKAADLLDTAVVARTRGQRNYAEQLFSAAEIEVGADNLAVLDPLFREGGPERITTKLKQMPKDTPAQPKGAVGGSEEDEPDKKPARGSLTGVMKVDGQPLAGRLGVIMVTPASGKWPKRTPKQRVIEQRDRQFAPHVMMVPVGSTVSFPNFDPVFHNVFSLSPTKPFDLGIFKNGESRDVTFEKEGILRIGCNLHANMSAYLVIVAAPHYVVTDANGKFRFKSLPPGKYKVRGWSERSTEPVTQMIEVKEGANDITVDVKGSAAQADLGTDKFGTPRGSAP
ncbi:MAG: globin domain-containing protein [Polyangia bacterium]